MSNTVPPNGPDGPEYLEQGGGSPVGRSTAPTGGGGRRTALIAGGVVGALAIAGGAVAFGVWWSSSGAQPAEALPDSTLGYASVNLDPSGEQKVELLRMLNKFPAFKDELGLDTDDDIKQKAFDLLELDEACDSLDYQDDIGSWLGDRAAVAAVDNGSETPDPAFVVQVTDADAAEDGLAKIRDCGGGSAAEGPGWAINGDWAVLAETGKIAGQIADDAADAPLSDDDDYQKWTDEVGDAGLVSMYAAPEAGRFLTDMARSMSVDDFAGSSSADDLPEPEVPEEFTKAFEDFEGAALTVRVDDGALEVETAGDAALTEKMLPATDTGDDVLSTLPADTAAAIGFGLPEGWFQTMLDQVSSYSGGEMSADDLIAQAEAATGLELPDDVETLLGESTAISVGPDIDPESFLNSDSPAGLPIGVKVKGDADEIETVIEKVRSSVGPQSELVISKRDGDHVAIGVDAGYVDQLLEDGDLGDSETFQDVVADAGDASSIVYVNFDAGDGWLVKLAGSDPQAAENLEPLAGLGASAWVEDDAAHLVFRLTTN